MTALGGLKRRLLADPRHGPLPALLLGLTVATGVVDAVSILRLGRVFVANMTGNIVFLGFAAAGAKGFSLAAALIALAGYLVGAAVGGQWLGRVPEWHRHRLLIAALAAELCLLLVAIVVAAAAPAGTPARDGVVALMAMAMGAQNAVVRRLGVPDLTTTVLTMTLTGIAADRRYAGGAVGLVIRLLAIAAMLLGAAVGALLVLRVSVVAALALAAGLLALVAVAGGLLSRRPAAWQLAG